MNFLEYSYDQSGLYEQKLKRYLLLFTQTEEDTAIVLLIQSVVVVSQSTLLVRVRAQIFSGDRCYTQSNCGGRCTQSGSIEESS